MRSRQEIYDYINSRARSPNFEDLIVIELLLDIRDQNKETIEHLKYSKAGDKTKMSPQDCLQHVLDETFD